MTINEQVKKNIYDYLEKYHELSYDELESYFFYKGENKEMIWLQTPYVIRKEGQSIVLRWEVSLKDSLEVESLKVIDLGEHKSNLFDLSPMMPCNDYESVKTVIVGLINKNSFTLMESISDFDSLLKLFLVEIILQENGSRVILRNKSTCVKEVDFYYSNSKVPEVIVNLPSEVPR